MRSDVVVVACVRSQNLAQMHLAQDNDVVQTLTPDRSDQPFGKAILPGRGWCCPRSNSHLWCGRSIRGLVEPPAVFSTFSSRFIPLAGSRRRAIYFQELAQPNLHVQPIRLSNLSFFLGLHR